MTSLETLADDMAKIRALGGTVGPQGLEVWEAVVRDFLKAETKRWLSEAAAHRRSGLSEQWRRKRRRQWVADGYARRTSHGAWEYHESVIPRRSLYPATAADPVEQARRDTAA